MNIPPFTDAELREIDRLMHSNYIPQRPREVILRLIATIRAHHPNKIKATAAKRKTWRDRVKGLVE